MIWFYLKKKKKNVFCLGRGLWGPHCCRSWTKNGNFLSIGFQLQLLILIESSNIFRWKPVRKTKVWS